MALSEVTASKRSVLGILELIMAIFTGRQGPQWFRCTFTYSSSSASSQRCGCGDGRPLFVERAPPVGAAVLLEARAVHRELGETR